MLHLKRVYQQAFNLNNASSGVVDLSRPWSWIELLKPAFAATFCLG